MLNICARRHAYHMQLLKAHSLADPSLYAESAPPSSSSGGEHTHATIAGRAAHACDAWVRRPLSGGANCADDDLEELLHSYLPQRAPGVDDLTRARRFDLPLTASAARMRPRSAQTAEVTRAASVRVSCFPTAPAPVLSCDVTGGAHRHGTRLASPLTASSTPIEPFPRALEPSVPTSGRRGQVAFPHGL